MSFQVTTAHIAEYTNNVEMVLSQTTAKLAPYTTPVACRGELQEITNLIGDVRPQRGGARHSDTQYVNTPHDRRWLAKEESYYFADLVDTEDQLRSVIALDGAYTRRAAAVVTRAKDEAVLRGIYGTALTGKTGGTQVAFPAGNIIPVDTGAAGATGLNMAKLRAARVQLMARLVDLEAEELCIALTARQVDNLLGEVQAASSDFISSMGGATVTMSGRLTKLFGFTIVECEIGNTASFGDAAALTRDIDSYRLVPFWARSGLALGQWGIVTGSIDRLPQKRNSVQVFSEIHVAASRVQEGKVGLIRCAE
jgi:hypothetical protein